MNAAIEIRSQTAAEEFEYLSRIFRNERFFTKNAYNLSLPDTEMVEQLKLMVSGRSPVSSSEMKSQFQRRYYNPKHYTEGLKKLESTASQISEALEMMAAFQSWGFKVRDRYQILLTAFGPGGSYYHRDGIIVMLVDEKGNFRRGNPLHTAIHEIVHIGIEESIVQKYELSHIDKETLVDAICVREFSEIIPLYKPQAFRNGELYGRIISHGASETIPTLRDQ